MALFRSALACAISRCSSVRSPTESTVPASESRNASSSARWAGSCAAAGTAATRSRPRATTRRPGRMTVHLVGESWEAGDRLEGGTGVIRRTLAGACICSILIRLTLRHGGWFGFATGDAPGGHRTTLGRLRLRLAFPQEPADPLHHRLGVETLPLGGAERRLLLGDAHEEAFSEDGGQPGGPHQREVPPPYPQVPHAEPADQLGLDRAGEGHAARVVVVDAGAAVGERIHPIRQGVVVDG